MTTNDRSAAFDSLCDNTESAAAFVIREMTDAAFLLDVTRSDEDVGFVFRRTNPAYRRQTGITNDEVRGETPRSVLGSEQGAAAIERYRRCVERDETVTYTETVSYPAGPVCWETTLTPITAGESVTQLMGVARETTAETAQLRQLHRRFETVLDTMSAAVFLKDTDGRYLLINRAGSDLLGIDADEIVGLRDEDLFEPPVVEQYRADDERVLRHGSTIEFEETVPGDETTTQRLTRKSPVVDDAGAITGICGVSTDITGQKRREQALRRLKERFKLAVSGANIGVWDWDLQTDELDIGGQYAEMLGYDPGAIEPHLSGWKSLVHPADIDRVTSALETFLGDETDAYDIEYRMRSADGEWMWIRDVGEVVEWTDTGEASRAAGIHVDIDERKQYETTVKAQRDNLKLLNQVVRHDVRNELQLVLAYAEMLTESAEEMNAEYLQKIVDAANSTVDITKTAAEVSKTMVQTRTDQQPTALRPVIETQVNTAEDEHQHAVIAVESTVPDVTVLADDMLDSVFRNVLNNAVVHNDKDVPAVTVRVDAGDEAIRVAIADNGPGIPDEQKQAIFNEGTTGLNSDGTGIGLYLVETLLDRYGGDIQVRDAEPNGSVFILKLPRCQ